MNQYQNFTDRLKLLISKHPQLITTTLSNIFTMRLIGNKTHGDLAEIAISEFINQYMYDFKSIHVGKDMYRKKSQEEDIRVIDEISKSQFNISLKAYGDGPLQLSTDKKNQMFSFLKKNAEGGIYDKTRIDNTFENSAFVDFGRINILPLIYNEKDQKCNILIFNYDKARKATASIKFIDSNRGRKHPVYQFYDIYDDYICEVRYGGASANALQRGLWTHTKRSLKFFDSLTNGWIGYSHNHVLVQLFSHSLVSTKKGHEKALEEIKHDINNVRQKEELLHDNS